MVLFRLSHVGNPDNFQFKTRELATHNSVSSDRNQKQSSNNEKDFMFIVSHTWTEYD